MNDLNELTAGDDIGFVTIAVRPSLKRRLDERQARIKAETGSKPSMTTLIADVLDLSDAIDAQAVRQ